MNKRPASRMAAILLGMAALVAAASIGVHAGTGDVAAKNAAAAAPGAVKIDNYSFTPQTITVPAGTTVTWTNADDVPHTVAADDMAFHSKAMDTDEQYSHTFDTPGTYKYFCTVHPKMTGTVVVEKK